MEKGKQETGGQKIRVAASEAFRFPLVQRAQHANHTLGVSFSEPLHPFRPDFWRKILRDEDFSRYALRNDRAVLSSATICMQNGSLNMQI